MCDSCRHDTENETMTRRIGMYFSWDRREETGAPLADLNNRFPALYEVRRLFWPRYETLADAPGGQDIDGHLQAIFFPNYARFAEHATTMTGHRVDQLERRTATAETLLTDALLDAYDTFIVISFDSKRTGQAVTPAETEAVRRFLARPGTALFVCPHHDIGDTDSLPADAALEQQTAEYHHHGDVVLPGQQRTGGFALTLMAALGAPVRNRFGLRPAAAETGVPAPYHPAADDRYHLLTGVPYLNLHPHLPHFERLGRAETTLEVLVRQEVSAEAPPHPVLAPGYLFDAVLQARPEAGLGRLTVCDPTLWTSTNGGVEGLEILWKNLCAAKAHEPGS
jgi:hypothetical protein